LAMIFRLQNEATDCFVDINAELIIQTSFVVTVPDPCILILSLDIKVKRYAILSCLSKVNLLGFDVSSRSVRRTKMMARPR
jgi:hypothetical protein